jgi:hypothetical protein
MKTLPLLLSLVFSFGCAHPAKGPRLGWIKTAPDGSGFVVASTTLSNAEARPFRPWGFNYDRDYKMRLLEDYWHNEWTTVAEDFQEMKELGANVVRVHLQFAKFMRGPAEPDREALRQLRHLLSLAEKTGLYLDLTGLACYRKSDVPEWYDTLDEKARWAAQACFWEAIARECKASRAVFCYDLMNEPFVPGSPRKSRDWLVGELAGFWYVQAITLDPAGRDRTQIAREWVDLLASAIRKQDRRHLITVGMLPNSLETPKSQSGFAPRKVSGSLDFISVHIYPESKKLEQNLQNLAGFDIGKPLVVEEIFPLRCTPAELGQFMMKSPQVDGWIGFYWGQTREELRAEKTMQAAFMLQWLDFFSEQRQPAIPKQ